MAELYAFRGPVIDELAAAVTGVSIDASPVTLAPAVLAASTSLACALDSTAPMQSHLRQLT